MARTYTVHGHFKRRDGRQEAFWTRTGLTKSAATKLAKEQRAEAGGVAKIVPDDDRRHGARVMTPKQKRRAILTAAREASASGDYGRARALFASVGIDYVTPSKTSERYHATRKKTPEQLDREIAEALAPKRSRGFADRSSQRAHATMKTTTYAEEIDREIAPSLGKSRSEIVRRINSIVRAADGRNVYLVRERLGENTVRRVTRARTKGRGMEVYLLDNGRWLGVMPELGDRIDVR